MPTGYLRAAEGELFGGDPPLDNPGGAIFRQFIPSIDAIFDFLVGYRCQMLDSSTIFAMVKASQPG